MMKLIMGVLSFGARRPNLNGKLGLGFVLYQLMQRTEEVKQSGIYLPSLCVVLDLMVFERCVAIHRR